MTVDLSDNSCQEADKIFNDQIKDFQAVIKKMNLDYANFTPLINELKAYNNYQNKIKKDLISFDFSKVVFKKHEICSSSEVCNTWTSKEILLMDIDSEIKRYGKLKDSASPEYKNWYDLSIKNFQKAKLIKESLFKQNPKFKSIANYFKSILDLESKTLTMALNVTKEVKKTYGLLYKAHSEKTKSESNPCRDFVI